MGCLTGPIFVIVPFRSLLQVARLWGSAIREAERVASTY